MFKRENYTASQKKQDTVLVSITAQNMYLYSSKKHDSNQTNKKKKIAKLYNKVRRTVTMTSVSDG